MSATKSTKKTPTTKSPKAKAAPAPDTALAESTTDVPVATETPAVAVTVNEPATPDAPAKEKKAKGKAKPAKAETAKKLSALAAAARVLADSSEPMNTKAMIEAMAAKKLWSSPGGKTPQATLYSAILREISVKGKESRFRKADKGLFAFAG